MTLTQVALTWFVESTQTQLISEKPGCPFPSENVTDCNIDPKLLINSEELAQTIRYLSRPTNDQYRHRSTALRLLTAWLDGLTFAEVSKIVGVESETLREILHARLLLDRSIQTRVEHVLEITRLLRQVIAEEDVGRWYKTSDPALNGLSPIEALQKNKIAELERAVKSYFDPSYG